MNDPDDVLNDSPANPFVALADFVIVLLVILTLTIVQQSLSNSSLLERAAIANSQRTINGQVLELVQHLQATTKPNKVPALTEIYVDGDLQRFRLRGDLCFTPDGTELTSEGKQILTRFGALLARLQGNPYDTRTRPFKRIVVSGYADPFEKNRDAKRQWELSLLRAKAAVDVLLASGQGKESLHPTLLEASGRGAYELVDDSETSGSRVKASEENRRLEIVVIYSGNISVGYLNQDAGQGKKAKQP